MKHKHHIIPKHIGGTDEESNIIKLTIEEHAEAHKLLWEQYQRWQDYLAWQGLAGLMTKEEIIKQMLSEAGKKGPKARKSTNIGKKYKFYKRTGQTRSTSGMLWYHNPNNPIEKCCLLPNKMPPENWIRGQGKKAKNPGLNFHAKKTK